MMMYVCISCCQLKHGDYERIDLNICEECAPDTDDDRLTSTMSTVPLYVIKDYSTPDGAEPVY
jgi:hypothetical protein